MSDSSSNGSPNGKPQGATPHELPPVEPPSAGFILQLFVVPAVIVAVLIVVVALFGKLAEGRRDPTEYLRAIREDNENLRWRAAFELANLIQNEKSLATDPKLVAGVASLLEESLAKARPNEDARLRQYLAATLGVFTTLDSAPASGRVVDPLGVLAQALDPKQPKDVRMTAAESLARQAARLDGKLDAPVAVDALVRAANDSDPALRQRAVFALGFCGGDTARKALVDRVESDEDRFVRYNAASALARRGDPVAYDTLREMLSPADLARVVTPQSPPDSPEARRPAEEIGIEALKALETSVKGGKPALAERLRPEVNALRKSSLSGLKVEAEALGKMLRSK